MLIDTSYFEAELSIGQITSPAVAANMNLFIEKYEEEYLLNLLGYPLYKAFIDGLAGSPIDQRWLDILNGTDYTYGGYLRKWDGLLMLNSGSATIVPSAGVFDIVVGGGKTYDPVAQTNSVLIPAPFVGKDFIFEQRAYGPLKKGIEYSISNDSLSLNLLGGLTFAMNDSYFYFGNAKYSVISEGDNKRSPIANYAYYKYQADNVSFTTGSSEKKPKTAITINVSPRIKMIRAWNEMVKWNRELIKFLEFNRNYYPLVYPEYNSYQDLEAERYFLLQPINQFGI